MARVHLRIEKPPEQPGKLYVATDDHIIAVGKDGTEVDISEIVTAWHEHNVIGEVRQVEVTFLSYRVVAPVLEEESE